MSKAKRGRPRGSSNRITNEAKRAILMAFDKIGGAQRLADWIRKDPANETTFWTKIFPRLLPRPAAEPAPVPDVPPPIRGALIWKTPDWAKQAVKDQRAASKAAAAAKPAAAELPDRTTTVGPGRALTR